MFCAPLTKIVTSQVGLVFIHILNVSCNPDTINQNQVKLGTLFYKQDEKATKNIIFCCHSKLFSSNPFFIIFEASL